MHQPYLSQKSHILQLIKDQLEHIKHNNAVKLNSILQDIPNVTLSEVIECLHEFLHSYEPCLEVERLTLQGNQLTKLPNNFSIIGSSIRYLDLHGNKFTEFPSVIGDIPNLEILDMSKNMLSTLVWSDYIAIGGCSQAPEFEGILVEGEQLQVFATSSWEAKQFRLNRGHWEPISNAFARSNKKLPNAISRSRLGQRVEKLS